LLIFLKEKKSGAIKARSCANGSVQREHVAKEVAAAPTVGLNSVFITSTIDAKEKRKVVTINIPGAFLHADNKDYVIMKMVGLLAELMAKNEPKAVPAVLDTREGEIHAISTTAEGTIWHDDERAAILQKTGIGTVRDGLRNKSIRSVCCEQDNEWDANDDQVACR